MNFTHFTVLTFGFVGAVLAVEGAAPQGKPLFKPLIDFFEWFGNFGMFTGRLLRTAFLPPYEGRELLHQLDEMGAKSLPLIVLAGAATGVVISLETRDSLVRFGGKTLLPAVI